MEKFVDFDGVIFDSETHLFDGYQSMLDLGYVKNDHEYLILKDWYDYLHKCQLIKDSLEILKAYPNIKILGKVCSSSEEDSKRSILKELGYEGEPIFVPSEMKKSTAVEAKGNLLVDDTIHNLDHWSEKDGYSLYFNHKGIQKDPWGNVNTKYKSTKSLLLLPKLDESYFE